MSLALRSRPPEIGTVVLQPTAFCNIDCTYCYLPDRNDKHVLAPATVERLFTELFASGWSAPQLTVIWHAGEPLVAPISFYREAFTTIARLCPPTVAVSHSFQTNGTLIDTEWCALFRDWKVGVGVSLDGPRRLHDLHRKNRRGAGTFDATMAGIRCLQSEGLPFHVISVLSHATLDTPDELLAFYIEEGIDHICFNVEESEGSHVSSLFAGTELAQRYAVFLRRFWQRARRRAAIRWNSGARCWPPSRSKEHARVAASDSCATFTVAPPSPPSPPPSRSSEHRSSPREPRMRRQLIGHLPPPNPANAPNQPTHLTPPTTSPPIPPAIPLPPTTTANAIVTS